MSEPQDWLEAEWMEANEQHVARFAFLVKRVRESGRDPRWRATNDVTAMREEQIGPLVQRLLSDGEVSDLIATNAFNIIRDLRTIARGAKEYGFADIVERCEAGERALVAALDGEPS